MKAAYLSSHGFDLCEVPTPDYGLDQILIRTESCGVCEGDVFRYRTRKELKEPELLGHEGSGEVVAVGRNVSDVAPGDSVTALGGAYAEYFVVESNAVIKLPSATDAHWTLGEPIACFVHASHRFGIQPGNKVAVLGCGYMGIGCLQMVKLQQAGTIIAIEPQEQRRDNAIHFGADTVYDPTGTKPEDVLEDLGEFDVVIEATGVAPAIDLCTALVKQHGRIILVGYHQSNHGRRDIDMKTWNYKAIDVVNGHVRRNNEKLFAMHEGIKLQSEGRLRFDKMLKAYTLDKIGSAFADLTSNKPGLYKAIIHMDEN